MLPRQKNFSPSEETYAHAAMTGYDDVRMISSLEEMSEFDTINIAQSHLVTMILK